MVANWWGIMCCRKRLTWFTAGYAQMAIVFPYLVAAPRYFAGAIELGGLMQTANAFGQVQESMSWFVDAYVSLPAATVVSIGHRRSLEALHARHLTVVPAAEGAASLCDTAPHGF